MNAPADALTAITRGMRLAKCRKCGCMQAALAQAASCFARDKDAASRLAALQSQMEPISYSCLGCRHCWGADALNALPDAGIEVCGQECCPPEGERAWPPVAGEYVLGNEQASVAVCTLANEELVLPLMEVGSDHIAIAGKCATENIGVEKLILNLVSNPRLRTLLLCGKESAGHRPGETLVQLIARGVDPEMRVLDSPGKRPVLRNLSLQQVARFREQVTLLNLIGNTDAAEVAALARDRDILRLPPLPPLAQAAPVVPTMSARLPKRLALDPGGFFIIIADPSRGVITCEHYQNDGNLLHVLEGEAAAWIAATAVEEGWVTRLDHAAYLGRELQRAEFALEHGLRYVQDGALGELEQVRAENRPTEDRQ